LKFITDVLAVWITQMAWILLNAHLFGDIETKT
jgi:hypothetical protein